MEELKITAVAKDGLIRLGNDIITLEDHSKSRFNTNCLDAFKAHTDKGNVIYYNQAGCESYAKDEDPRYRVPETVCTLETSEWVNNLMQNVNKPLGLDAFEKFLRRFKKHLDSDGLSLLSHVKDFSVCKVTKVVRKKDNRGNLAFGITREGGEKEDFHQPDKIAFTLPVFDLDNAKGCFEFDIVFGFSENDQGAQISFSLENLDINDDLKKIRMFSLEESLKAYPSKYWGSVNVLQQTDKWKYEKNAPTFGR